MLISTSSGQVLQVYNNFQCLDFEFIFWPGAACRADRLSRVLEGLGVPRAAGLEGIDHIWSLPAWGLVSSTHGCGRDASFRARSQHSSPWIQPQFSLNKRKQETNQLRTCSVLSEYVCRWPREPAGCVRVPPRCAHELVCCFLCRIAAGSLREGRACAANSVRQCFR